MAGQEVYIAEGSPAATSVGVGTLERPNTDVFTTTTADPGTGGTTLAVTAWNPALRRPFPAVGGFKVRVLGTSGVPEVMLVTAGAGSNSWTVTRSVDAGGVGLAHSVGATVQLMEAVQIVHNEDARKIVSYRGRVNTFRQLGRAGTAGQKIAAIHNATGSTVLVDVDRVGVDRYNALAIGKIGTVLPPIVRLWKFTAVPTNGTALTKVPEDSALTSNSAVTVWGDSSADGTNSGTTLTVTLPAGTIVSEEFAPDRRFGTTGTGTNPWFEPGANREFLVGEDNFITLRPLEGLAVFLDYTGATSNPVTDHWLATMHWTEYRLA